MSRKAKPEEDLYAGVCLLTLQLERPIFDDDHHGKDAHNSTLTSPTCSPMAEV